MPIIIYDEPCTRCNVCADVCPGDIITPNRKKTAAPVVRYQDECWHCGACVNYCPEPGAIALFLPEMYKQPLINKARRRPDGTVELLTALPVQVTRFRSLSNGGEQRLQGKHVTQP